MQIQKFNQFAGFSGIISALLFIVSIVGMQYYLASSLEDMSAFTKNMVDAHQMMLVYGWPGLIATVLIIPLIYAFYRSNVSVSFISKMVFIVTLIGLAFILVGYLFHLALTYFYAPIFQGLDEAQQRVFDPFIKATIGLQDMFWLGGDLFSFLGIALLLLMGWKEGTFPKWLIILGVVAGFFAAIGSFSFIPAFKQVPGLSFLFIGGFSVFAIWEIAAGIFLIHSAKSSS